MTLPLDDDTLLSRLRSALAEAGIPEDAASGVGLATSLSSDLGLDSFQLTEVARALEADFSDRLVLLDWILEEEAAEDDGPAYRVSRLFDFIRRALKA